MKRPWMRLPACVVALLACLLVLPDSVQAINPVTPTAQAAAAPPATTPAATIPGTLTPALPATDDGVLWLEHGEFVASDAPLPPAAGWTPVALPDNWRLSRPQYSGYGWYRLRFTLPAVPREPQALYLPRLALIGELWFNGSLLSPDVRFDEAGRKGDSMADAPLYLVLPSALFRPGENMLDVRLQGDRGLRSGLPAIRLGPTHVLHPVWLLRYLPQVVAPYILLVLVAGALCFLSAYARRQRHFGATPQAFLAGLVTLLLYLTQALPVSRDSLEGLRALASLPMYWLLCVEGYRLSGFAIRGMHAVIHGLSALTVAAIVAALALGDSGDDIWMLTWPHLALRVLLCGLLLVAGWRRRSPKLVLLALSAALWCATVAQSYLILMEWLPWDAFRWSVAGALPFCVVLIFVFAERFILDREESARERQAAIATERGRILQDMHDGMGAQLITARRLAQRPDVDRRDLERAIEESLQDLRLIIDSLDLTDSDLLSLLGNLRFRLAPRLATLGIRLTWDVLPPPELDALTPTSALAILRIVQEAINNALRHAAPAHIRVSVRPEGEHIVIRVADDGQGFDQPAANPGSRGLAGMRLRAERIGARLDVRSAPGHGTEVSLTIPTAMPPTP
ncbi:sensor histidine kinase [Cupriavidus basilensis]|uniref:sensor histidine kinase n=1 Tax=Cupriavidus basilensis TaxID=68895 RepID=UPI000750BB84|nr:sensor histidine kinase [Cupriavidus basilensis]